MQSAACVAACEANNKSTMKSTSPQARLVMGSDKTSVAHSAEALDDAWNWKVYWGGTLGDAYVVHWHGMKPTEGPWLDCLVPTPPPAECPIELGGKSNASAPNHAHYLPLFNAALRLTAEGSRVRL